MLEKIILIYIFLINANGPNQNRHLRICKNLGDDFHSVHFATKILMKDRPYFMQMCDKLNSIHLTVIIQFIAKKSTAVILL